MITSFPDIDRVCMMDCSILLAMKICCVGVMRDMIHLVVLIHVAVYTVSRDRTRERGSKT
jgi:hypothetical protein